MIDGGRVRGHDLACGNMRRLGLDRPDIDDTSVRPLNRPGPAFKPDRRVALMFKNLGGGGVQRSMLRLAQGLIGRGLAVDLMVDQAQGDLMDEVPIDLVVVGYAAE